MAEPAPNQVEQVTISLPRDVLDYLDRKQVEMGVTRSELVRRAVERVRREDREREADVQYMRSYREHPQQEDFAPWPTGTPADAHVGRPAGECGEDNGDDEARRDLVGQSPAALGSQAGTAADKR